MMKSYMKLKMVIKMIKKKLRIIKTLQLLPKNELKKYQESKNKNIDKNGWKGRWS